jgi:hypothetical protein
VEPVESGVTALAAEGRAGILNWFFQAIAATRIAAVMT